MWYLNGPHFLKAVIRIVALILQVGAVGKNIYLKSAPSCKSEFKAKKYLEKYVEKLSRKVCEKGTE